MTKTRFEFNILSIVSDFDILISNLLLFRIQNFLRNYLSSF